MATCSPRGFPEMPRTSGSFMPDTLQGRARSINSSYEEAHRECITQVKPRAWPQQRGLRWAPAAQEGAWGGRSTQRSCPGSSLWKGSQTLQWATMPRPGLSAHPCTPGGLAPSSGLLAVSRLQISGQAHVKETPPSGPLEKPHIYPDEAATIEIKPFLREVCSVPGLGPAVTLELRLSCVRKPTVHMFAREDWDLGLLDPARKKFLSPQEPQTESRQPPSTEHIQPNGLPVGCTQEKLCPSWEEPGCRSDSPAAPSTGPAVGSSSAQHPRAAGKLGPPVPKRMAWRGLMVVPKGVRAHPGPVSLDSRPSGNGDPRPKCKKSLPH